MRLGLAFLLVALGCGTSKSSAFKTDAFTGADAVVDSSADAADAPIAPLASCTPTASCGAGSDCITGCPTSGPERGVCSVPGRDMCGCGAVLDPCETPGTVCLMPACCDYKGVCVTPAERADICSRPEGARFDCNAAGPDSGP